MARRQTERDRQVSTILNCRPSPTMATSAEAVSGPIPRNCSMPPHGLVLPRKRRDLPVKLVARARRALAGRDKAPRAEPLNRTLKPVRRVLQPSRYRPSQLTQISRGATNPYSYTSPRSWFAFAVRSLDQACPNPVHRLDVLLLDRLDRYVAHTPPAHRLADRLRVVGVVLVALHVRLHKLRRNQLYHVALRLQQSCPVMRTAARLHPNLAARLDMTLKLGDPATHASAAGTTPACSARSTPCT